MYRTFECVLTIASWEIPLLASSVSFGDSFRLHCVQFTSGVTRAGGCPGQNFSCWWWLWWLRRAKTQDRPGGKKRYLCHCHQYGVFLNLLCFGHILVSFVLLTYACMLCASLWHIHEFILFHCDILMNLLCSTETYSRIHFLSFDQWIHCLSLCSVFIHCASQKHIRLIHCAPLWYIHEFCVLHVIQV